MQNMYMHSRSGAQNTEGPLSNSLLKDNLGEKQPASPSRDADSTDVSKADAFSPQAGLKVRPSIKEKALYDWSEVAYLFEDGQIP